MFGSSYQISTISALPPPTEAARIMRKAGYIPLEPYVNSKSHWKSTHKECGRTVSPAFANIASGTGGCKWCGVSGLDYSAPSYLYIVSHQEFGSLKVGISNDATDKKIEIASTNTFQDCFNNYLETSVLDDSNSNPLTSFDLVPKASENGTEISDIDP